MSASGSPAPPDGPPDARLGQPDQPGAEVDGLLRYRLLTGTDDRAFCEKVSAALAQGYVLHGSPAIAFDGTRPVTAQAVVLPPQVVGAGRSGSAGVVPA